MLEGLVAWLLNNYLGRYLENLNTDQLSIALLQGEVELENVPLRKSLLMGLDTHLQVRAGFVGKVKLQIPMRKWKTEPWVIILEGVYLVVGPKRPADYSEEAEEAAALEVKLSRLDTEEVCWRAQNETLSNTPYSSSYYSWLGYGASLMTNILENFQLSIQDVHVRYEDDVSFPSSTVAFGLTLGSVVVQSCDKNWVPKQNPGHHSNLQEEALYKLLELKELAFYSQESTEAWGDLPLHELAVKMKRPTILHHILAPVNGRANVKRHCSPKPLRSLSTPRLVCDLQLDCFALEFTKAEYQRLAFCLEVSSRSGQSYRHYSWRPEVPVLGHAREYWQYAIQATLDDCKQRNQHCNWNSALSKARGVVQYVSLYSAHLEQPIGPAQADLKKEKDRIESQLPLEELQALRRIAMKKVGKPVIAPPVSVSETPSSQRGQNLLQNWFPAWTGWYAWPADSPGADTAATATPPEAVITQQDVRLEEELWETVEDTLKDNSLFQRDLFFGQFKFSLRQGTVKLLSMDRKPLLELQVERVEHELATRPRLKSYRHSLSLGQLTLKDCLTENSLYPVLVAPQTAPDVIKSSHLATDKIPLWRWALGSGTSSIPAPKSSDLLFQLIFEKRPLDCKCDYRLKMSSAPLDIVYHRLTLDWVRDFFANPLKIHADQEQQQLPSARAQLWSRATRAQTLWDVELEIAAPQVLFPEDVTRKDSLLLVVDFGKLHVANAHRCGCIPRTTVGKGTLDEEDEEYVTPCSTPPNEPEDAAKPELSRPAMNPISTAKPTVCDLNVDRYSIELTDLQVLVGRVKDNWKHAPFKSTGAMHVLDRFSVFLQLEKSTPAGPSSQTSLALQGSLPNIVAHLNEPKIQALKALYAQVFTPIKAPPTQPEAWDWNLPTPEDVPWLTLHFCVDHLSVELQSRGRSVAELQVTGVQAAFTHSVHDSCAKLSVHSLLLVDAMQRLGPDFELLCASHKAVSMDSRSGSLKESEPTSPCSPSSPNPAAAPHHPSRPTSPHSLAQALASLQTQQSVWKPISTLDDEALISLEVTWVKPKAFDVPDKPGEALRIVNVIFNSLDVIANQDTLVELWSFLQRISGEPRSRYYDSSTSSTASPSSHEGEAKALAERLEATLDQSQAANDPSLSKNWATEVTFDFRKLTILLLRPVMGQEGVSVGRKVATVTFADASIHATLGETVKFRGWLGGVQVYNLTPEGQTHARMLSLGRDPSLDAEHAHSLAWVLGQAQELYGTRHDAAQQEQKAFTFAYARRQSGEESGQVQLEVSLASVVYVHCPALLAELWTCASQFHWAMAHLGHALKAAAAEVALDLVHRGSEALAQSLYLSNRLNTSTKSFHLPSQVGVQPPIRIQLKVVLESPILVVPRSSKSSEVLVAHLGQTTITNSNERTAENDEMAAKEEDFDVEIREVSLYALNVEERWKVLQTGGGLRPSTHLYNCARYGRPILHDTALGFRIQWLRSQVMEGCCFEMPGDSLELADVIKIEGGVVTPLKVSLTKSQYQQLVESLSNLSVSSPEDKTRPATPTGPIPRQPLLFTANFQVPSFELDLHSDAGEVPSRLVRLSCTDFVATYDQTTPHLADVTLSLKSFKIEDPSMPESSKRRYLMSSLKETTPYSPFVGRNGLSTSCPDLRPLSQHLATVGSLPDRLSATRLVWGARKVSPSISKSREKAARSEYPTTPPPSPSSHSNIRSSHWQDNLVHVKALFVDPNSPDFASKHDSTHQFVDVDCRSLDIVFEVRVWAWLLNFFRRKNGSAIANSEQTGDIVYREMTYSATDNESIRNSQIGVQVEALTIILAEGEKQVARSRVKQLSWHSKTQQSSLDLSGKLGQVSVCDLTPSGALYREKFVSSGEEALDFQLFWYGTEDPRLLRDYDARLRVTMASVLYVHTQRFYMEFFGTLRQFLTLQSAAAPEATAKKSVPFLPPPELKPSRHGARWLLSIEAGAPVLLLPASASSDQLIAVDLGRLYVSNVFLLTREQPEESSAAVGGAKPRKTGGSGAEYDPNSPAVLMDVMHVELAHMDLYSARRHEIKSQSNSKLANNMADKPEELRLGSCYIKKKPGPALMREKCSLKLKVSRNLDSHRSRPVPDMSVRGILSAVHCTIDAEQYVLIRSFLNHNLGEPLDDLQSLITNTIPSSEPIGALESTLWTTLAMRIELQNVTLELMTAHPTNSLAKIDFLHSYLSYESFSDQSRDIDLFSEQVRLFDTRQLSKLSKGSNIFPLILEPVVKVNNTTFLQAELHYRTTPEFSRFTVLLNSMRLLGILDWWLLVREFIWHQPPQPIPLAQASATALPLLEEKATVMTSLPAPLSGGVLRRPVTHNVPETPPFEFRLSITDSELVLVEDSSLAETNALIVKCTAVVSYRPQNVTKPFSCQLTGLELFSVVLGFEEDTALSIIDPVSVGLDVVGRYPAGESQGLLEATEARLIPRTLEIHMHHLSCRLSYHDWHLFRRFWERFSCHTTQETPLKPLEPVEQLASLGFREEDCHAALEACHQELEEAALWLTQNAEIQSEAFHPASFSAVELRAGCVSFCVIDDCKDADVPLLEVSLTHVVWRRQGTSWPAESILVAHWAVDYYNRVLSGWEPLLEPVRCNVKWKAGSNQWKGSLEAEQVVNVNVTSALLDLYRVVKANWTEEYYQPRDAVPQPRRRSPFVPFALYNATGAVLKFRTLVSSRQSREGGKNEKEKWLEAQSGETMPFSFEPLGKSRHRDSHESKIHQLVIQVANWTELTPVSVDRVGVFFRHSQAMIPPYRTYQTAAKAEARIVIAVTLEGSARKLVTVRSGLQMTNRLEETVELKMELPVLLSAGVKNVMIPPCTTYPIPLSHLTSLLYVRPLAEKRPNGFGFCNQHLQWWQVTQPGDTVNLARFCPSLTSSNGGDPYRLCVHVQRDPFPVDHVPRPQSNTWLQAQCDQAAHTITLGSPITLVNLLPYDLSWEVRSCNASGWIKPGKESSLHFADLNKTLEFYFGTENYLQSSEFILTPNASPFVGRVRLYDSQERLLFLQVRVSTHVGGAWKLSVSAAYWIVNRTGLPLVFRQEATPLEAAGQSEEHEIARSVAPLMYSWVDRNASLRLEGRLGQGLHPDSRALWCRPFSLNKGSSVRRLHANPQDHRPAIVYTLGVAVRPGRGRYRDTHIVTLAPQFQLHNHASQRIQLAQRCFATTFTDPGAQATFVDLVPSCHLAFHWPRLDKDQLLCVRLPEVSDDPSTVTGLSSHGSSSSSCIKSPSLWSGGFRIDSIQSFTINIRDADGQSHFLRIEVLLQECTYFVVFSDATTLPPPFRIDNRSPVPVTFFQACIYEEHLQTTVKPLSSLWYAWDEPMADTRITCRAPGGSSATINLAGLPPASTEPVALLTYDNFIYLAMTYTFQNDQSQRMMSGTSNVQDRNLVLDVLEGGRVVLMPKEPGKRSQLWRFTGAGMLQHEGSSPPRDPKRPQQESGRNWVLDIAGPAPQPAEYVPLTVRKPDSRRQLTQTWRFTPEGRLCSGHSNVFVQPKDGFAGFRPGKEVVLGPSQPITFVRLEHDVPAEQALHWQRLRPGSGSLGVKVLTEGPTRVLRIYDLKDKDSSPTQSLGESVEERPTSTSATVKLDLHLDEGLGISLVHANPPEELLYCTLSNIRVEVLRINGALRVDGSIQNVQVDSALLEVNAPHPVVLYVTPVLPTDASRHLPALHFTVHHLNNENSEAQIFKHLIVTMKNMTFNVEEELLFKFLAFWGFKQSDLELERLGETEWDTHRNLNAATSLSATRYYFGTLQLALRQVRLSVFTSSKLSPELQSIKSKLGLTIIKFEEANIELNPFTKLHPFETAHFLLDSIGKHYKSELRSQSHQILGSVDFLGNPLGFVNDVSEGVSGLLSDGNVSVLVKNVTHGLSNSAAKMTGSLSDQLGRLTLDDHHEDARQRILRDRDRGTGGWKALGLGLYGGLTSVVSQTFQGASAEGFTGFFTGLGKGMIGTVTKPAVGVLDLAAGVASAVRDSSKSASKLTPERLRLPRVAIGPGGLLPRYSQMQGRGQLLLYQLNGQDYSEQLVSFETLRSGIDDLHLLLSTRTCWVFSLHRLPQQSNSNVWVSVPLSELQHWKASQEMSYEGPRYYVELALRSLDGSEHRPHLRCDSQEVASRVVQEIVYAKNTFEQNRQTLSLGHLHLDQD